MKKIISLFTVLLFSTINFAQIVGSYSINDPVSAAMGNVSTANSRDTYAIHRNPANLSFMENGTFGLATVFPLPNLSVNVGTDFMTIDEYNYYFGGIEQNGVVVPRPLTDEDKQNLQDLFSDGGVLFSASTINYLNMVYKISDEIGAVGFSISDNATEVATFPQGLIELTMNGNVVGRVYDFNDLSFKGSYLRDYTFSYSRDFSDVIPSPFSKLSFGISVSYVQGLAMARSEEVKTSIVTNPDNTIDINGHFVAYFAVSPDFNITYDFDSTNSNDDGFNFTPLPSPAGTGFGLDFGFTAGLEDYLTFGLAINNIGSVSWDNNVAKYESNTALLIKDITNQDELDSLKDEIKMDGKYVDGITTSLPTVLRLGAALQVDKLVPAIPGTLLVAADIIKGFNDEASNSKKMGFGLGLEWRPFSWLPIMTGFAFGNDRPEVAWSLGTGVDVGVFAFTIAAHNFSSVVNGNNAKTINYVMGSRWRF